MKNKKCYKLAKNVNNPIKGKSNSYTLKKHTIINNSCANDYKNYYSNYSELERMYAEDNITTIADLNFYLDWIKQYGKQ